MARLSLFPLFFPSVFALFFEPGLVPVVLAGVAAIVWAVRIEGKVNNHTTILEEREKQSEDRHNELQARLIRIEAKLDREARG